jgi:hypothetical protein
MSSQPQSRSVLLIGTQDAGKSNFLFRLWLALDNGGGILAKAELPEDLDYLKTGAEHLLKGEFAPHTPHDVNDKTVIPVQSTAGSPIFSGTLIVPDLPGEQVSSVFRSRRWSDDWEDQITDGCGCLILIRPDSNEIVAPLDWLNCPILVGAPIAATAPAKNEDGTDKPPTQVVMVEWLQFLRTAFTARVGGSHRPLVGIVVTAWDLVPEEQKAHGAEAWIKDNLPMLAQYAHANDDEFEFQYFGVSVTSGNLEADQDFKKQYMKDPRHAGEVVHRLSGKLETSQDMTLPVAWALGIVPSRTEGNAG